METPHPQSEIRDPQSGASLSLPGGDPPSASPQHPCNNASGELPAGRTPAALPVPVDTLCLATGHKGQPCRNPRKEGSDYCYRHQPRELPAGAAREKAPFPALPAEEELTTPEGVRRLIAGILGYIAENDDADLPRVYAMQAYTGALLRAVDVAQLQTGLQEAQQEVARLKWAREELVRTLESERRRRPTPQEEEFAELRASVARLTRRNQELEAKEDDWLDLQEQLEATLADQRQEREIAERTLADTMTRLREAHRGLCLCCGSNLRPLVGGTPRPGDSDYVDRR